jgi:capsular polysaccharide biosynthesis protein
MAEITDTTGHVGPGPADRQAEQDVAARARPVPDHKPALADKPPRAGKRTIRTPLAMAGLTLLIVSIFAGSALGYSLLQPPVYGAESEFVLTPRPELSDAAVDRELLTQTMIVTSPSVLEPVARESRVPLKRLQEDVKAEMAGRSNVLRITVADRDSSRALTLSQLVTDAYTSEATPVLPGETESPPPITSVLLTPPQALDEPLQPRPWRALAAGTLIGLLVAAAALVAVWRPWRLVRPAPYWT